MGTRQAVPAQLLPVIPEELILALPEWSLPGELGNMMW